MKTIKTQISADKGISLIEELQDLPGAISSEETVGFLLDNGSFLKFSLHGQNGDEKLIVKLTEKAD